MAAGNYIAIGDVHGCANSLNGLLEKLSDYRHYTHIFIGDYIDRGPDSSGVINRLIDLRKEIDCIFLRGNHEQMLLDAYHRGDLDLWLMNGGKFTLKSYGATYNNLNIPPSHLAFYEETKMYFETDDYFFVHAGLAPEKTIKENLKAKDREQRFLWQRSHLKAPANCWEKTVVFGHTPRAHPICKQNMLGIDTGCVFGDLGYGRLTAVILPKQEFIQQLCVDN